MEKQGWGIVWRNKAETTGDFNLVHNAPYNLFKGKVKTSFWKPHRWWR